MNSEGKYVWIFFEGAKVLFPCLLSVWVLDGIAGFQASVVDTFSILMQYVLCGCQKNMRVGTSQWFLLLSVWVFAKIQQPR
jgi:hypothetical protein